MFKYTAAKKQLLKGNRVALSGWNKGTALFVAPEFRTPDLLEKNIERKSFSGDAEWKPTDSDKTARDWVIVPSTMCDTCRFILPTCAREDKGLKKNDNTDRFNIIECKEFIER